MSQKIFLFSLFSLMIFVSACKGEATLQPTTDPGQMETQVAEQVSAQLTQIALDQPTSTMPAPTTLPATDIPLPTDTTQPASTATTATESASQTPPAPLPTNTSLAPTATFKPLPTATTPAFACQITKQIPENSKTFKPGTDFDTTWTVKNVGTVIWSDSEFDYRYDTGDKIHQIDLYDLSKSVEPGESIDLTVDMLAPDKEGKYTTTWILHQGNAFSCKLTLEINVQK